LLVALSNLLKPQSLKVPFFHRVITFHKLILSSLLLAMGLFNACDLTSGRLINGAHAPDLLMYDVNGNLISSSEVVAEKKIVLIDFWASWCKPCRQANPELVKLYQKYKDANFASAKGFEIISVSLDTDKSAWLGAIAQDKLEWPLHVCDYKGFGSPAPIVFQFEKIPTTYLIDERGIIIGKDQTIKWMDYELSRRVVRTKTPENAQTGS